MVKVYIESYIKDSWPSYMIKAPKRRFPDTKTVKLCEFEGAQRREMPKGSRLSDFMKMEFGLSKSEFKRKVSEGALKRPNPFVETHYEKVFTDPVLEGIDSYRLGRCLMDIWFCI